MGRPKNNKLFVTKYPNDYEERDLRKMFDRLARENEKTKQELAKLKEAARKPPTLVGVNWNLPVRVGKVNDYILQVVVEVELADFADFVDGQQFQAVVYYIQDSR